MQEKTQEREGGVRGRRCIMGPLRALTTKQRDGFQFQDRGCPRTGCLVGEKDLEGGKWDKDVN